MVSVALYNAARVVARLRRSHQTSAAWFCNMASSSAPPCVFLAGTLRFPIGPGTARRACAVPVDDVDERCAGMHTLSLRAPLGSFCASKFGTFLLSRQQNGKRRKWQEREKGLVAALGFKPRPAAYSGPFSECRKPGAAAAAGEKRRACVCARSLSALLVVASSWRRVFIAGRLRRFCFAARAGGAAPPGARSSLQAAAVARRAQQSRVHAALCVLRARAPWPPSSPLSFCFAAAAFPGATRAHGLRRDDAAIFFVHFNLSIAGASFLRRAVQRERSEVCTLCAGRVTASNWYY